MSRSNDRTNREASIQERARLGHDQVRLEELAAKWRRIQIRECHRYPGHGINGSQGRCVARLIRPCLKVSTMSCVRLVSRSVPLEPVAVLPGKVRNGSRSPPTSSHQCVARHWLVRSVPRRFHSPGKLQSRTPIITPQAMFAKKPISP